jgi:hypothetical protein
MILPTRLWMSDESVAYFERRVSISLLSVSNVSSKYSARLAAKASVVTYWQNGQTWLFVS